MKIYKFKKLISGPDNKTCEDNKSDFCRLKDILELEKGFYCPSFYELNDPMEGVFCCNGEGDKIIKDGIDAIYNEKKQYKICSFSGINGFKNPLMWGYYAEGGKGVAIEVEVAVGQSNSINIGNIEQIEYVKNISDVFVAEDTTTADYNAIAKGILIKKLESWKHEDEFRFLIQSGDEKQKVGKITAIYFGDPYSGLFNANDVQKNKKLKEYRELKNRIIKIAEEKEIKCFNVKVEKGVVKKMHKNLWSQK